MNQNRARMKADAPMDLVDLIKRLIIEWRAILLFAALMSLLFFFVYQRQQARKAPGVQKEQPQEASQADISAGSLRAGLTDADYNSVMLAVRDASLISDRSRYLDQSVWVNQSANGAPTVRYLLSIAGSQVTSSSLRAYYKYFLESSSFVQAVGTVFDRTIPENDLREMIVLGIPTYSASDSAGDPSVIEISILLTGNVDKEALDEIVRNEIASCHDTISASVGEHTAEILSSDLRMGYDINAVTRKREILYELYNLKAQLKSTVGEFSSAQNVLYSKLTDGSAVKEEEAAVPVVTDGGAKKKYLLAGAALAVFLYIVIAVILTLITSRIHSPKEMSGIPCLGELRRYRSSSFWDSLFRSRLFYRLLYRPAETKKVVDLLGVMLRDMDASTLTVVTSLSQAGSGSASEITSSLAEAGISTRVIALDPKEAILPSDLTGSKNLVLVLEANYTKYRDVLGLWSMCDLCGIPVHGYILTGR